MAPKKQASVKPEWMSDFAWKVFMAHKGTENVVEGIPTRDHNSEIIYVSPVNLARLADQLSEVRDEKPSLLAVDYERSRQKRIKRSKED
jgi:hypothetical protein